MDPNTVNRALRLIVVDDDAGIRELLAEYLTRQGMLVTAAADGSGMWRALAQGPTDLVVLDLNLPGTDGLSLCRQLRERAPSVAVIMLTARADPIDRVVGLELGADDYVPKPFEPRELAARIRNVLRRAQPGSPRPGGGPGASTRAPRLRFAGWTLDVAARQLLAPEGAVVMLTSGEFRLLRALVEQAGRVLSRDQLLNYSQGRDASPFDRSIDLHVSRLRAKLRDDARMPALLKTVRNEGYLLASEVEVDP
jgi:two-component system OmpR family response regulator